MDFINGNRYVGDWKNGIIEGKGKMIFSNGVTYEGQWLKNSNMVKAHKFYEWRAIYWELDQELDLGKVLKFILMEIIM